MHMPSIELVTEYNVQKIQAHGRTRDNVTKAGTLGSSCNCLLTIDKLFRREIKSQDSIKSNSQHIESLSQSKRAKVCELLKQSSSNFSTIPCYNNLVVSIIGFIIIIVV